MIIQIEKALVTGVYVGKNKADYVTFQLEGGGELKLSIPKELMTDFIWGKMIALEAVCSARLFNNNLNLQVVSCKVKAL